MKKVFSFEYSHTYTCTCTCTCISLRIIKNQITYTTYMIVHVITNGLISVHRILTVQLKEENKWDGQTGSSCLWSRSAFRTNKTRQIEDVRCQEAQRPENEKLTRGCSKLIKTASRGRSADVTWRNQIGARKDEKQDPMIAELKKSW